MHNKMRIKTADSFLNPSRTYENMDLYVMRTGILKALKEFLPKCHGTFLDIGCGTMPYKPMIVPRVKEYIGLDIENQFYQEKVKPDLFWDGMSIPLENDRISCAIATELLGHLAEPHMVIKEIYRVLKPQGILFFTVPFYWPIHDTPHNEFRHTPYSLNRILHKAGFKDIKISSLGGWNAALAQMIGLWVKRKPMKHSDRMEFAKHLFPFYESLIEEDEQPNQLTDGPMFTGLYGTATKGAMHSTSYNKCQLNEPATNKSKHLKYSYSDSFGKEGNTETPSLKKIPWIEKRKRLIIITDQFPVLSQTFILDQIVGLVERNIDIEIWTLEIMRSEIVHPKVAQYDLMKKTRLILLPDQRFRASIKSWVNEFFRKNGDLDNDAIQAFHIHFGPNFGRFEPLFRVINNKVVVSFHGYDASAYLKLNGAGVYQSLFSRADIITTPSRYMKNILVKSGCSTNKILVHRYGVDTNKFSPANRKNRTSILTFLTVARFVEKKGLYFALQAFARFLSEHNAFYRIVGDGPLMPNIRSLCKQLGISENVTFLGSQNHNAVLKEMTNSDIYVLTSITARNGDQEGVPVCLIEAQSMGLPVISSRHAGIPELVDNGISGYLAEEKNVDEICGFMKELATNKEIRHKFGQNARERIECEFNINSLNDQLVRYLYDLNHFDNNVLPDHFINGVKCPICGAELEKFQPFGIKPRQNALCSSCNSLERHRLFWLFLNRKTQFFEQQVKVLDIAPASCLSSMFQGMHNVDYVSADISSPLSMIKMDLPSLQCPNEIFDYIFCSHVLEHIPDDRKALSEILRVLKYTGLAIIQVPIDENLSDTIENSSIVNQRERPQKFGQEDHVRYYGRDFTERLIKAGFHTTTYDVTKILSNEEPAAYGVSNAGKIHVCQKLIAHPNIE